MESKEKVGPIGDFAKRTEFSTYRIARMTGLAQITVWRHMTGAARIDIDSMEAYEKIGIPIKELIAWNKALKERKDGEERQNSRAQRGDSGSDTI